MVIIGECSSSIIDLMDSSISSISSDSMRMRYMVCTNSIDFAAIGALIETVAEVLKWAKQIQDARKEEEELDSVKLEDL